MSENKTCDIISIPKETSKGAILPISCTTTPDGMRSGLSSVCCLTPGNERYVLIHSNALCFEFYLYAEMSGAPIDRCAVFVV